MIKISNEQLIDNAKSACNFSHSPYSKFPVGACLLASSGRVYNGCNIENASFSAGICAERVAFFNAISCGEREFEKIAIVSKNGKDFCFPCGVCLQVMTEFCKKDFKIVLLNSTGLVQEFSLSDLYPFSFDKDNLK